MDVGRIESVNHRFLPLEMIRNMKRTAASEILCYLCYLTRFRGLEIGRAFQINGLWLCLNKLNFISAYSLAVELQSVLLDCLSGEVSMGSVVTNEDVMSEIPIDGVVLMEKVP